MIPINFTEQDIQQLTFERYNHPHPRVQQKMWVLYLKSLKVLSHELISIIADVSPNTMRTYFKEFKDGGINSLKQINFYSPKSKLIEYKQTIEQYFKENPPSTINEASAKIEELTGIKRGATQTSKFIKSIGLKLRKVGQIPANALKDSKKKNRMNF